uniref:RING-type zinc-finger protein n=1 Tax=Marseillevirus LCMAC201 TaxID=2506605 RepID=A0A481YWQ9_9VIRU|nr:MAG: RING-type zinc-finger protein [Marseillevirus LCMAC201]
MESDKLKGILKCGICLNVLRNPNTLLCQHNFCQKCLVKTKLNAERQRKCPICNVNYVIPKEYNRVLQEVSECLFSTEHAKLKSEEDLQEKKEEIIDEVRKQLHTELYNQCVENSLLEFNMQTPLRDSSLSEFNMQTPLRDSVPSFIEVTHNPVPNYIDTTSDGMFERYMSTVMNVGGLQSQFRSVFSNPRCLIDSLKSQLIFSMFMLLINSIILISGFSWMAVINGIIIIIGYIYYCILSWIQKKRLFVSTVREVIQNADRHIHAD